MTPIDIIRRKYESVSIQGILLAIFRRRLNNFLARMSKALQFSNFKLILTNRKRKIGYYSFKGKGDEICLDYDRSYGWLVCLCNKWEEVVDETMLPTKEEALEQANKFYQCFGKLDILYK